MACPAEARLQGGLVGIGKRCRRHPIISERVRGHLLVVGGLWRAIELDRGRGIGWSCDGHIAVACPTGAGLPGGLVDFSKHRGLGFERDSDGINPVGRRRWVWFCRSGRDRGSDGSAYRSSLSLAVATTRTRNLVGVWIILVVSFSGMRHIDNKGG